MQKTKVTTIVSVSWCLLPAQPPSDKKKQRATGPVREGGREKRQQRLRNWEQGEKMRKKGEIERKE